MAKYRVGRSSFVSGHDDHARSSRRSFLKLGAIVATGAVAASVVALPFRTSGAPGGASPSAGATKEKPQFSLGEVRSFFNALQSLEAKTFFLLTITTGLKKREILSLKLSDLDLENRKLTPRLSAGATQKSWVSFYNEEAAGYLSQYVESLPSGAEPGKLFPSSSFFKAEWKGAQRASGVPLKVKSLKKVYRKQMSSSGVPKTYVNALRGKPLKNIGAASDIDLSSEKLKEVYDGARLKILSD
jgi:integrase